MTEHLLTPENSQFRSWFRNCLGSLSGNSVEWPFLMRQILAEELQRLRASDQYYKGPVFRNRDDRVETHRTRDSEDEEILVYRLYGAVHENNQGVLTIGETPIWLFMCQVPNQGKALSYQTKSRRADLLGLRQDGSLVVFECKGPRNRQDSPLYGLLEGLDYLGCLLTPRNLTRLNNDLQEWIVDHKPKDDHSHRFSSAIPEWPSFVINPDAQHSVVVLAPQTYFDLHVTDSSGRSNDWWLLSNRFASLALSESNVDLDFAVVDFDKGMAGWLEPLPTQKVLAPSESRSLGETDVVLPHDLIWFDGKQDQSVTKVRRGGKNTRIQLSDGTTRVVSNHQLRPAMPSRT